MGFINLMVASDCKISFGDNNLILRGEYERKFPIQDINSVLIESQMSNVSTYLLSKLAQQGVAVFVCDERHMPCGILMPYGVYFSQYKIYKLQTQAKRPLIKQLWQSIVKQKISNQGDALTLSGKAQGQKLVDMSKQVLSDDTTNIESTSARLYFRALFGENFDRRKGEEINACLNYGYSIVRGLISRSLASNGFCTFIGLHHCNELNNFNLSDDLIEPYRAIVDRVVYRENLVMLDKRAKQTLFGITNVDVFIDGKKQVLARSIDIMIDSLRKSLEQGLNVLSLPSIIEPLEHKYE